MNKTAGVFKEDSYLIQTYLLLTKRYGTKPSAVMALIRNETLKEAIPNESRRFTHDGRRTVFTGRIYSPNQMRMRTLYVDGSSVRTFS